MGSAGGPSYVKAPPPAPYAGSVSPTPVAILSLSEVALRLDLIQQPLHSEVRHDRLPGKHVTDGNSTQPRHLPDYRGGSIVNLMASIRMAFGGDGNGYPPLAAVTPRELQQRHVVLIVIDGLGYDFLSRRADSTLFRLCRQRITSVFPTTTASAMTTFMTGVAPQQHGVTGWFTWFRELGTVATVLPFTPRYGGSPFTEVGIEPQELFNRQSVFAGLEAECHMVNPFYITESAYSRAGAREAQRHPYHGRDEFFGRLRDIVFTAGRERTFTLAYWPELDGLAHRHGVESEEVSDHFDLLDAAIAELLDSIAGTDTAVLVTADHGLLDTDPAQTVLLNELPDLQRTLTLPLCGEPRAAYCYVRARSRERFEAYIRERLGEVCDMHPSFELIEAGLFGSGDPHPHLVDRVGDYTLLMRDNYVITEQLLHERRFNQRGVHGGLSSSELYVPLILARP